MEGVRETISRWFQVHREKGKKAFLILSDEKRFTVNSSRDFVLYNVVEANKYKNVAFCRKFRDNYNNSLVSLVAYT